MKVAIGEKLVELESGQNIFQALKAAEIDTKDVYAARIGGRLVDLSTSLTTDCTVEIITADSSEGREIFLHSSAHILAYAVMKLYPDTLFAIGPAIKDGFYYDLEFKTPIAEEDLAKIEKEMKAIVKENVKFERSEMNRLDAIKFFKERGDKYKVELLEALTDEAVSFYTLGDFIDLCRGPHLPSSRYVKNFKLTSIAGAYWRGDEKNQMLTRIYGTSYPTAEELDEHMKRLEEIAKRDHRILGRELELFTIDETVGGGLVVWLQNGSILRTVIEDFWRNEHYKRDYSILYTPHIGKAQLWRTSGHLDFYAEGMYPSMELENVDYYVRPMNCPFHMINYKAKKRSYRELPMRTAELGTVYRFERSGTLHGLLRVRGFTQDDAHIFCTPEQLDDEVKGVVRFAIFMLETFGFMKYEIFLSTRPKDKFVGEIERWDTAEKALIKALEAMNLKYDVDEGGGAFYGPKIDIKIVDALGRPWQTTTCQFDFNLPERFDLTYIAEDGKEHRPYIVHRALLGSLERFVGCLTEHYAGAFPLWLAPKQAVVVPITDDVNDFAKNLCAKLREEGMRADVDLGSDRMQAKIRNAELKKVPYVLVVGRREAEEGKVAVRRHGKGDQGAIRVEELIEMMVKEVREKTN
ncbi:MAG TPA: threonine--tRNA ligase [Caldisericia bacterium]|nr:threonine--tRNA ligase [Caldisericia bacterium]HPF49158.1 threonine--tRNA ligase [Caldisericia bacterium]HPI82978.1 threonine--tRNA ligase [Caldisericia bacterium]HPQ92205.1 threonine--tRNA ligase [Caldisericia bacterium]HRV74697.1 threonine--tRNA ligase [Caldisericia bacterium]